MEAAGPAGLSGLEKEQLKQKLASLKREYSKTLTRLQRSQRAETVHTLVQDAVAEQNGLLAREETEKDFTGSLNKMPPDKSETCWLQTNSCCDLHTKKKLSVSFKLEPECFNNKISFQESPWEEGTNGSQQDVLCGPGRPSSERDESQLHRTEMEQRETSLVSEEKTSVCDGLEIMASELLENRTPRTVSPVFKRRNISDTEKSPLNSPKPTAVRQEGNSLTPQDPLLKGDLHNMPPKNGCLEASRQLLCASMDDDNTQQMMSLHAEDHCEPTTQCSENDMFVSFENTDDAGKERVHIESQIENESADVDQGEVCRILHLTSENKPLLDGRKSPVIESRSPKGSSQVDTKNFLTVDSLQGTAVQKSLENQEAHSETESTLLEKAAIPEAESALSSCTVVEGLLFPVEYYVRTTRRMSNCQRKVDLEAVILSQLGKGRGRGRKGVRSKCKQNKTSSDQPFPPRETAGSDVQSGGALVPAVGREVDTVSSESSSQKSLPLSDESGTSSGPTSQNSITAPKRGKGRLQRRGRGRDGSACKPAGNVSLEPPESLRPMTRKEVHSRLSNDSQSEKENCEGGAEKLQTGKARVPVSAVGRIEEAEMTCITWPTAADLPPGGSGAFDTSRKVCTEHVQSPCQGSHFLNPGDETFTCPVGDLEAKVNMYQAAGQVAERARNWRVQKDCSAQKLPADKESLPQHQPSGSSLKRKVGQAPKGKRRSSRQRDLGSPAPSAHLVEPGVLEPPFHFQNKMLSPKWLPSVLEIRDFHLPDEEFGLLKDAKLQSSARDLEPFVPVPSGGGEASEGTQLQRMNAEGQSLERTLISPPKTVSPKLPHFEGQLPQQELSLSGVLLIPLSAVSAGAPSQLESQGPMPAFPSLGATPAFLSLGHSGALPDSFSAPSLQMKTDTAEEPEGHAGEGTECSDSRILHSGGCGTGSARRDEVQCGKAESFLENKGDPDEDVPLEEHQQSGSVHKECCSAAVEQNTMMPDHMAVSWSGSLREGSLRLVSKLKDLSGSCAVDVSTVWWEESGCPELCVVTACETSVSLWKPLSSDQWRNMCTWHLTEKPVIQIVPLPDVHNLVCAALGDLEIGELRVLLCSSEDSSLKQSVVKTGNIKAVLGLKDRRLVSSSRTFQEQQVEIISFLETGRNNKRKTLMAPKETVLAFAEVEGIRDALIGTTTVNSVVVWNLKTGQLLKKMHVGYSYPASVCHRAYSDSGLLFVVLSHPHAKESESCGNPAFRVIAFNPKTGRSAGVMFLSLPPGHTGRYLEGEVKDASAAAVLTSGTIAVWDLLLGDCATLLPPESGGPWSLVRWSARDSYLLAGQKDGSVCVYSYSPATAGGREEGRTGAS
ncbi:partner and localizer of BRCA2 isoform X1 [Alligator mississippiensis]|uniref:partner and localizer of BRCA2 isoform X1 n=2 Tax=Alligator mississippiensis TaxID=8496 RepID=UPI000711B723|nr:partner and localizer of BRCA2 isoform X1 [Alligator mississippiensis]